MNAYILNTSYEHIAIVDRFESFIWTDRYIGEGEFELYLPMDRGYFDYIALDNYLWRGDSDKVMIIENIELTTDPESANHLTVSGRSLESILRRRVVWKFTQLSGNVQDGIKKLLDENAISPSNSNRTIPGLIFKASTDSAVTGLTFDSDMQFLGDNLYEAIYSICESLDLGFRITLSSSNQLIFELYKGADHSYDQSSNPVVVFSYKYENLLGTRYYSSKTEWANAMLVGGTGDGVDKKTTEALDGSYSGLSRREIYVEASVETKDAEGNEIAEDKYLEMLKAEGTKSFAENALSNYFDGEVEAKRQFVYGRDFLVGDVVQVENEYGMQAKCRVMELVFTHDTDGETIVPTFSAFDTAEDQ